MNWIWKSAFAATLAVAGVFATMSIAQDRGAVVPDMKVLLENGCVRVQYHDVAVGQTIPMHSHPNYVVYVLESFKPESPSRTERNASVSAKRAMRTGTRRSHTLSRTSARATFTT